MVEKQVELELVRSAKDGDAASFEELVKLHQKRVYNLALRMSGNPEDALDLSQEVFLRIYKALPLFKEQSAFSTWVYSIASNVCIDFVRKRNKLKTVSLSSDSETDSSVPEIPDNRYQPELEYEKNELRESIAAGLSTLSDEHREILVLREICGLSYQEICDALDLEGGTVKSRLSRARNQLCVFLRNMPVKNTSKKEKGR